MPLEYSRSRNGNLYDYFYCLERQRNPRSCDFVATRCSLVEQRVLDHYRDIQLLPEKAVEIRAALGEALSARRNEAVAVEQVQTLRIQRLSNEREKLLRLHYAEAIPFDLFKKDQERIARELRDARDELAAVSVSFETIDQNLSKALELVRDCHAAYEGASAGVRRQYNQAIFEKLYVQQDGDVAHELAEPFKILLNPQLPGCLATGCEERMAPESEPLSRGA